MPLKPKTVIVIAGPTAAGKTGVAIQLAKHFQTQIISADSRQCYAELNIGVARPNEAQLAEVKHHFIASHSIQQKVTAASFETYALEKAAEIFEHNNVAVMVGGTGLYIRAFCEGMDAIPEIPYNIQQEITANYKQEGLSWLQAEIQKLDPQFWSNGEIYNPQRMMRALEVVKASGNSILHFRNGQPKERPFNIIKIALELERPELYNRINQRVDEMMKEGLVDEVKSLLPYRHLNALQTVGYKEIFQYLDGNLPLARATEQVKQNTRQYAKRQVTWFKKEDFTWLPPDAAAVLNALQKRLENTNS